MNFDFSGKTAIVTGAAHGFGRAISIALAQHGARVWACDLIEEELLATHHLCTAVGKCETRVVDIADTRAVDTFVSAASAASGRVDILVNNAGGVLGQTGRPLETVSPSDWQSIFDVNVSGAFYFSQAVAPGMKAAGSGRI